MFVCVWQHGGLGPCPTLKTAHFTRVAANGVPECDAAVCLFVWRRGFFFFLVVICVSVVFLSICVVMRLCHDIMCVVRVDVRSRW